MARSVCDQCAIARDIITDDERKTPANEKGTSTTTRTPWREGRHFPEAEYLPLLSSSIELICVRECECASVPVSVRECERASVFVSVGGHSCVVIVGVWGGPCVCLLVCA